MKIIFFGLGSIGLRHANILKENVKHQLFAFRSNKNSLKNPLGIKEVFSWKEVEKVNPDLAFITNPTSLHTDTAIKCAKLGCKLFIEKPVGKDLNGLEKLLKVVKRKNLVTYVGYPLRFHPVIKELKKYLLKNNPLHFRAVCTSFLPNWRPGADYLKSYSVNAKMGGGVILDLSHEIDYVNFLLGPVVDLSGNFSKAGSVTVDTEDNADILVTTRSCQGNIHINFLSHLKQRYIQLEFGKLTVVGDILNSEILEFKNGKLKKRHKLDYYQGQEYETQMKYFFKNLDNPLMMNNLKDATKLFKRIIAFKESHG